MHSIYKLYKPSLSKLRLLGNFILLLSLQFCSFKAGAVALPTASFSCTRGAGTVTTGSSCTAPSGGVFNSGWGTGDYWQYTVNTLGYSNITMSFITSASATGPHNASLTYNIGAGDVNFGSYMLSGTTCTTENITLPATVSNAGTVTIKIFMIGSTSGSGTNRITTNGGFQGTALSITPGTISSTLCAGHTVHIPYIITGTYNADNVFTAQLSDATGSFASPDSIGSVTSTANGTITATIPATAIDGTGYRIRIVSNSTIVTGTENSSNLTIYAAVPPVTENDTICSSQLPYTWNGKVVATGGTAVATDTLPNVHGCDSIVTLNLAVKPSPAQPGSFTSSTATVCQGDFAIYTVPNDTNATYNWSYTGTGETIAGAGDSVAITFGNFATSGTLSVTAIARNGCGVSAPRSIAITVNPLPSQPTAFTSATTTVCQGRNNVIYTVPNDTSITYNWSYTVGTGAMITGTGNSVSVNYSTTATDGTLNVTATAKNGCGISASRSLIITVKPLPAQPAAFTTAATTVCQGQGNVGYAIPNDTAVTYNWTYSGTGATITGTGDSVTVNYSDTATSGTLSVSSTAKNSCGVSAPRNIAVTVIPLPVQPATFTTSSPSVCQGQNNIVYTIPNDAAVTYNWTYSGTGATITGAGNSVTVNYSSTATSGMLSVTPTAINGCGTAIARSIAITVKTAPAQPAPFTTSTATVCQGQNNVSYAILGDTAVTYNWSYTGTGANITGTGNSVTINYSSTATSGTLNVTAIAKNGCGLATPRSLAINVMPLPAQPGAFTTSAAAACQGQNNVTYTVPNDTAVTYNWNYTGTGANITGAGNSVTVNYSNTATNGTLSVTATANNGCGISAPRNIVITVNPLPAQPAVFTTATTTVCQGQNNVTYTVPDDTAITYNWNYTGTGATITGTGNSVTVNYNNTATSGTLNVIATAKNGCGISAPRNIAITIKPLAAQPAAFTTSSATACQGQNNVTYTVPNDTAVTYNWGYTGTGATITGTGNSVTVSYSATATSGTLNVTATANNGCGISAPRSIAVTVPPLPVQPAAFTASSATVCQGQDNVTYTVPDDTAVTYNWSYTGTGATITGTGNSVTVNYSDTATSGMLSVTPTAKNGCGMAAPRSIAVTMKPAPAQPAAFIISTATVCQGQNNVAYAIPNDTAVTYNWSYTGTGATITGAGNSVTVNYSTTATNGALNVTATANNGCGISAPRSIAITIKPLPAQPAAFTTSSIGACQGQNNVTYTVPDDTAVTYNWNYTGTGTTITGTGNSVTVNYSNTATNGTLSVTATANNGCGISAPRSIAITINPLPAQPAAFTTSSATVCQGQNNVTYTVPDDTAVTYNWSYTGTGATITGTSNSVTISYSDTATNGTLNVAAAAKNGCGISVPRGIAIMIKPLPAQPAAFTAATAAICQGQNNVIYTVPNDTAVTYNWSYTGTGATITGTGNSITVNYSGTTTNGTLSVTATANNGCGISAPRGIAITINPLPAQPGAFTTSTATVCQGQNNVVYTVPNDTNVIYNWSYTGAGAAITGTGNSVTINYSNTAASGTLSVTATAKNSCSISAPRSIAITIPPSPAQPSAFTTSTATVCLGQNNVTYTVPNDTSVTYNWNYTGTGVTITGTGNSVTVNYSDTATSGTINVTATAHSGCGISLPRSLAITFNPLPMQPGAFIAATATVCKGQDNVIYNVPNDATITYNWSYTGTGATITGTSNNISVNYSSAATSGNISVTATNGCGTSIARTIAITVNPLPVVTVTAGKTLCPGGHDTLTANGATTYSWSPPATLSAATGSTVVATPTLSTTYTVTGTSNGCSATATTTVSTSATFTGLSITPAAPAICNGSNVLLTAGSVTALSQSFNSVPTDWTSTFTGGMGAQWTLRGYGFATDNTTLHSADGTSFYEADGTAGGGGAKSDMLTSPVFSLTGLSAATLTYYSWYDVSPSDSYHGVEITTNGGVTWTSISSPAAGSYGGTQTLTLQTASLNAYIGNPNVQVRFRYTSSFGYAWAIDNINITGTPLVIWSPATAAFTNATLTTPYTGTASNTVYVAPANTGTTPTTAIYTASFGTCSVMAQATVTIKPTPTASASPSAQVLCSGTAVAPITESSMVTGTTYTWTNNIPAIGIAATGVGNINTFTAANTGSTPDTAVITITPTANLCQGASIRDTIVVKPTPVVIATPATQTVCNNSVAAIALSCATAGTTYAWANNTPAAGLAASGTGNITFTALNPGNRADTATITVTPTANGCAGTPHNALVVISPSPVVTITPDTQTVCNGTPTTPINFTSTTSGTTYTWSNDTTAIGLAATGTGNIAPFTGTDTAGIPVTATITVTPTASTCVGAPQTATVTIKPSPTVTASPAAQSVCNGAATMPIVFTSTIAGNSYTWTSNSAAAASGLAATGTTGIASFTAYNVGNTPVTDTITLISAANACTSVPKVITITVNPTPVVSSLPAVQSVCNGTPATIVFSSTVAGASYSWSNTLPATGLAATGTGNIGFTAANSGITPVTTVITVVPTANGCIGLSKTDTITVRPTPPAAIASAATPVFCPSDSIIIKANTGTGLTYQWQLNNVNIPGATQDTFKANPVGNYTAVVTNTYNCPTTSNAVTVTHLPSPVPLITPQGATSFCQGDSILLKANTATGLTYFWKLNGIYISQATTPSFVAHVTGNYTVYESNGTCNATSPVQPVTVIAAPPAVIATTGSAFFCTGDSLTLYSNAGNTSRYTYQYQLNSIDIPGATTQNYNTHTIGSYTVTVTATLGCYAISSAFPVGSLLAPTTAITPSIPTTICSSDSMVFVANVGSGLSYQWQQNGSNIPAANTISFNARTAGNYSVKVTGSNGCSATTAAVPLTVTAGPGAVVTSTGATTACAPGSVALNANTGPGLTYQWQQDGASIAGATNAVYAAGVSGNYSVQVSNGACAIASVPVQVTINPLPADTLVVYAPNVICDGSTLLMRADLNPAYHYQWMLNGANISSAQSAFYSADVPGSYSVNITSGAGCTVTTTPVPVNTAQLPAPSIAFIGGQLCAPGFATYQWYYNNLPMAGETNPCINIAQGGGYTVAVTNTAGCSAMSPVYSISTGVANVTPEQVKLYPNPATSIVNINAPHSVNVSLNTIDGRQVVYVEDAKTIDISQLPNAVYLIKVYDKGNTLIKVEKLVVSR